VHREIKCLLNGTVVLQYESPEVSGVVTVDGELDTRIQERPDRDLRYLLEAAEADVGQRADSQQDLFLRHTLHQLRILHQLHAMVDPLRPYLEGRSDVACISFLAGMRGERDALGAGRSVDLPEHVLRRANLRRGAPDTVDNPRREVPTAQGLEIEPLRIVHRKMLDKAENQPRRHPEQPLRALARGRQARHDGVVRDAAVDVDLGVEEDLCVVHAVRVRVLEVLPGQVLKVRGVAQDGHASEVEGQEVVQRGEVVVPLVERLGGRVRWVVLRVRQADVVPLCELEDQPGRQAALDVDVMLAFGEAPEELMQRALTHSDETDFRALSRRWMLKKTQEKRIANSISPFKRNWKASKKGIKVDKRKICQITSTTSNGRPLHGQNIENLGTV